MDREKQNVFTEFLLTPWNCYASPRENGSVVHLANLHNNINYHGPVTTELIFSADALKSSLYFSLKQAGSASLWMFAYLEPERIREGKRINIELPLWVKINILGFPCGSVGKESVSNLADLSLIPGLRRSPKNEKAIHSSVLAWRIPWTVWSIG